MERRKWDGSEAFLRTMKAETARNPLYLSRKGDPTVLTTLERACLYNQFLDEIDEAKRNYPYPDVAHLFEDMKLATTKAYGRGVFFENAESFAEDLIGYIRLAEDFRDIHGKLCPKGLHDFRAYIRGSAVSTTDCCYCGRIMTSEDERVQKERNERLSKLSTIYKSFPTIFFQPEECLEELNKGASLGELNTVLKKLKEQMPTLVQDYATEQVKFKPTTILDPEGRVRFSVKLIENGSSSTENMKPQRLAEINKLSAFLSSM
jgi:hypothetical protein